VLINGAREYVPQLLQNYPEALVIWIEAEAGPLPPRPEERPREQGPALLRRIQSASTAPAMQHAQVIRLENQGSMESAGQRLLDILCAN
jgi:ribose 1,5-bisphosphokinase